MPAGIKPAPENGLCRDCAAALDGPAQRCPNCGSRRLFYHAELNTLSLAHIDCDAFFAAVEKRDNPALRKVPLIIGGGGSRGVVSTACYIARMYGVHSAMPMFKARRACPDAVILPPNIDKYRTAARQIREAFLSLTPAVESVSIDEAFIDLAGTERLHGEPPVHTLVKLAARIERDIGITVSIGLSYNKFLAKLASDMDKPRGLHLIGRAETLDRLAPLPITKIYGVGKAMTQRLKRDGLTQIGQLQSMDEAELGKRYGEIGLRLSRLARGLDRRSVKSARQPKSISSERTLSVDLSTYDALEREMWAACERVSHDLKRKGYSGRTVTLKLKTSGHRIITRARSLAVPTQLAARLFDEARPLLAALADGTPYRLVGISASGLADPVDADTDDLASPERSRVRSIEHTLDRLRDKYGTTAIGKGRSLPP